jgi:hypothetical protein
MGHKVSWRAVGQLVDLDWNLDEFFCVGCQMLWYFLCCICHFWFLFQYHRLFICFYSAHNKCFLNADSISVINMFFYCLWHCICCAVVFFLCAWHTALCSQVFARVPQHYTFADADFMIWYLHLHFHCLLCILMVLGMNRSSCLIVR